MMIEALFVGGVMDGKLMAFPRKYPEYIVPVLEGTAALRYASSEEIPEAPNAIYQLYIQIPFMIESGKFTAENGSFPVIYALSTLKATEVFSRIFSVYWKSKKYIDQVSKRVDIMSINVDNPFANDLQVQRDLTPKTDNNKP